MKSLKYLDYLIRHKIYVFLAGLNTGSSIWRLLVHDWSKLTPCEWFPYLRYFYGEYPEWDRAKIQFPGYSGRTKESVAKDFQAAWLHHIHCNKHHWQHFLLVDDPVNGTPSRVEALEMPEKYVREMVADWAGAGKAITGKWRVREWYEEHKDSIILHPQTRMLVEELIEVV